MEIMYLYEQKTGFADELGKETCYGHTNIQCTYVCGSEPAETP
jgi:hypothetical protein